MHRQSTAERMYFCCLQPTESICKIEHIMHRQCNNEFKSGESNLQVCIYKVLATLPLETPPRGKLPQPLPYQPYQTFVSNSTWHPHQTSTSPRPTDGYDCIEHPCPRTFGVIQDSCLHIPFGSRRGMSRHRRRWIPLGSRSKAALACMI